MAEVQNTTSAVCLPENNTDIFTDITLPFKQAYLEVFTNNNHPLFHKDKIKIFFKHKQAKSTNVHEKPTNANNSPTNLFSPASILSFYSCHPLRAIMT